MSLLDNLPHVCTAKKRLRAKDSMIGSKDTYGTILFEDKSCWRQPMNDRQIAVWKQEGVGITHMVYFAEDPGLDEQCILVMGTEIMFVRSYAHPDASVGLGLLWRVLVELK